MRWVEAGVQRTKSLAALAMLLLAAVTLQGCWLLGGPLAPIPDSEMTAEDFDDTIAFEPAGDAEEAVPPLEVHEIDESQVTAAGGKKVVDGRNWLDADDFERNDILNLVAEAKPAGSILVIVVATGEIWQIPLVAGQILPDGVRPWTGDEYYEMDEYYDGRRIGNGQLTVSQFVMLTSVANSGSLGLINYVHPFGKSGYQEIKTWQGFQVALARTWLRETPVQRYLRLTMLNNYFGRLPQFQGEGNRIAFGVMVPGGGVYVMPEAAYRTMIVRRAILAWTSSEIFSLSTTLLLLDRQIKNTRIVVEPIDP